MNIVPVEPQLNVKELFRLLEIAYDTHDHEVRKAAKELLHRTLYPLYMSIDEQKL